MKNKGKMYSRIRGILMAFFLLTAMASFRAFLLKIN